LPLALASHPRRPDGEILIKPDLMVNVGLVCRGALETAKRLGNMASMHVDIEREPQHAVAPSGHIPDASREIVDLASDLLGLG
jgi:hypothetical protein